MLGPTMATLPAALDAPSWQGYSLLLSQHRGRFVRGDVQSDLDPLIEEMFEEVWLEVTADNLSFHTSYARALPLLKLCLHNAT